MRCYLVLALVGLTLSLGCAPSGPKTYKATGTVTYNGAPLEKGQITFMPKDGQVAPAGGSIIDGKYTLETLPGVKLVEITASREEGPVDTAMGKAPQKQFIPAKYNVESKLEANVTIDGPNTFDFPLDDK